MTAISTLKTLLLLVIKLNLSICYMKNIQKLEKFKNIGLLTLSIPNNCVLNGYRSFTALNAEKFNDYEFLDSGNLKRLERFGGVTVVRSCPSAIWPVKLSSKTWSNMTNVAYDGTSGKVGKWSGLENIQPNWTVKFPSSRSLILKQSLNKIQEEPLIDTSNIGDVKSNDLVKKPLVFTLSCSDQGQVGVFPEQQDNWIWIRNILQQPSDQSKIEGGTSRKILNGFAYTGGSSLAALSTDLSLESLPLSVQVVHLDAAKASVQWAMRNAIASGLINSDSEDNNNNDSSANKKSKLNDINSNDSNSGANNMSSDKSDDDTNNTSVLDNRPTARFIIDDCTTFLEREVRRGNKYDGLIFDPPAFGRASSGKIWKLEKDLPILIGELIPKLLSDDPLFVLISCHDINWPSERLAELLSVCMNSVSTTKNIKDIKKFKNLESKNIDIKNLKIK